MKLFAFIMLLGLMLVTQKDYQLLKKINKKTDFIALDNLGYLYIYENYNLKKYTNKGILLNNYTNLSYGKLSFFDASDPYMLLLYYQNLNEIIFLDNRLAPIGNPINLDELGLYQVDKVCKSKEFAVWIYDDFDKRVIQYGFNPKGILNEINLSLLNIPNGINFMSESGNYLYLSTGKQLYVFDIYGTLIKQTDIDIPNSFQISNNKIIYFKDDELILYAPNENITETIPVGLTDGIINALMNNEFLYIQKKDSVLIYTKVSR